MATKSDNTLALHEIGIHHLVLGLSSKFHGVA